MCKILVYICWLLLLVLSLIHAHAPCTAVLHFSQNESTSLFISHLFYFCSLLWARQLRRFTYMCGIFSLSSRCHLSQLYFCKKKKKKYFCSACSNLPSTSHTTEIHYVHYFMRHNYGLRRCPAPLVLSNPFFAAAAEAATDLLLHSFGSHFASFQKLLMRLFWLNQNIYSWK